ncbi:hypothetical protein [Labilibaculum euxinus]
MGRNSRLFGILACIQECLYYFVGIARPICGESFRNGGLPARFAESHSEMGDCPPDLRRVIPKWGTARPICRELFPGGVLPAQNGEASPVNKYG